MVGALISASPGLVIFRVFCFFMPVARCFQSVGDFLGDVVFVVFGKDFAGNENALGVDRALGHDALTLAKEVRQDALVGDGNAVAQIGDTETEM